MPIATFNVKKITFTLALTLAALWSASACEMSFKLADSSGSSRKLIPGSTIALESGTSYTLKVEFVEDHRNCLIPPEDTLFLLGVAKWRVGKEEQGLVLAKAIAWTESGRSLNLADVAFKALRPGNYSLSIQRECAKGGYDEVFAFVVK
jgi:hypothetical protein